MANYICSTFTVPGFHNWIDAPGQHEYLGNVHRHLFYFRLILPVGKLNREVEFIEFGQKVKAWVFLCFGFSPGLAPGVCNFAGLSCEAIADKLVKEFHLASCSVFEDNENGAIVTNEENNNVLVRPD